VAALLLRRGRPLRRAALALLAIALASGCTQIFLQPGHMQVHHPSQAGLAWEDVWLPAPDGARIHGWWLPAVGAARGTVLHFHGNGENITTFIGAVHWLPPAGYNVLLVDYRGYGRSEGVATIDGVHEDARIAIDAALARAAADQSPLFVFGQSLGGSVAIHAVARHPERVRIKAVISEGAFSSYRRIAREKMNALWLTWPLQWPASFLFSDRYAAEASVAALAPVPLLVVHGTDDIVVPPSHAQRLYDAAREPRELWLVPGRHVAAFTVRENRERLLAYLAAR
jgi:hypothetical protein